MKNRLLTALPESELNFLLPHLAHTIDEAFRLIESRQFDLYIFDNWLHGSSGIELCRKVRRAGFATPIIFVSGVVHNKDIQEAISSGADKYLTKPCEPDLLKKIVKELIN
ncbi:MAG TPA: response regulator [Pyrinomonadaceae bacterium]|jgi:DNA-binding response OmpR family regulator